MGRTGVTWRWRGAVGLTLLLLLLAACGDDDAATTSTVGSDVSTTSVADDQRDPTELFTERDVIITRGGFDLAGTLSTPVGSGPFPGVILVTGSGPQDRNETLLRHQPFLDIAIRLAAEGIVVLRYDDRGFGESGGEFDGATIFDFADDAVSAIEYLSSVPEVDVARLGIVGHSEGGVVAPLAAAESDLVSFVVSLAGPGVVGHQFIAVQDDDILRAEGASDDLRQWRAGLLATLLEFALSDATGVELDEAIHSAIALADDTRPESVSSEDVENATMSAGLLLDPGVRFFLSYDPHPALQALDIPVLAVLGELDVQVSPDLNEQPTREALAANPNGRVVVLDGINHLLVEAQTGTISEYWELPGPTADTLLDLLVDWIKTLG